MLLKDINTARGPLILLLPMSEPTNQNSRSYMHKKKGTMQEQKSWKIYSLAEIVRTNLP